MPLESNPQKLDDLNEAWPVIGEAVEDGYLHFQQIKKVAKTRASVNGVYGITKLSSATDSDAEDVAATPKAVKIAKEAQQTALDAANTTISALADQVATLQNALDSFEPGLADAAVGSVVNWRTTSPAGEVSRDNATSPWTFAAGFRCVNGGTIRLRRSMSLVTSFPSEGEMSAECRILKNGSTVVNTTRTGLGTAGTPLVDDRDISINPGDLIYIQLRVVDLTSFTGISATARLEYAEVLTSQEAPAILVPIFS